MKRTFAVIVWTILFAFGPFWALGFLYGIVCFLFLIFGSRPPEINPNFPHSYLVALALALAPLILGLMRFFLAHLEKLPGTKRSHL
jgi:hypothetical protein